MMTKNKETLLKWDVLEREFPVVETFPKKLMKETDTRNTNRLSISMFINQEEKKLVIFSNLKDPKKHVDIFYGDMLIYAFPKKKYGDGILKIIKILDFEDWDVVRYTFAKRSEGWIIDKWYSLEIIDEDKKVYLFKKKYSPGINDAISKKKILEGEKHVSERTYAKRDYMILEWKKDFIKRNKKCEFCDQISVFKDITILHAHHSKPLSTYEGEGLTKKEDIFFICPNCHSLVHKLNDNDSLCKMNKKDQKYAVISFRDKYKK